MLGALSVAYCVVVLSSVVTSPDLRLRCLLVDDQAGELPGVKIQAIDSTIARGMYAPKPNDRIVRINDQPTTSFMSFSRQVMQLNRVPIVAGGSDLDDDPARLTKALEEFPYPPLVRTMSGRRIVRVDVLKADRTGEASTWLEVQSQPLGSVTVTIIWFVFELGITLVGAFAFWKRRFDRSARQFFAMCLVTMAAFVGGYHWWAIAGNLWLNIPFILTATLLPAVTLHFFLIYPRPKPLMLRQSRLILGVVYAVPVAAALTMVSMIAVIGQMDLVGDLDYVAEIITLLGTLRTTIYTYVSLSGIYFLMTLVALVHGFVTTRNPIEQKQVKAILGAAVLATLPVAYTLYLAYVDHVAFAFGEARIPMFLASLSFMLAYANGILRYKLMVADQLLTRGMSYYVVSFGLTTLFGMTIAATTVLPHFVDRSLTLGQEFFLYFIVVVVVLLVLGLRDRIQRFVDRQFFREKYQLDKALQRVNRAIGNLVDQDALAEMMLTSSCEVLQVDRAALYLRGMGRSVLTLAAVKNMEGIPVSIPNHEQLHTELADVGTLQRVVHASRDEMSSAQQILHELRAELIHGLEVNDELAGIVVLGHKKNNSSFSAEDLTFLHATGQVTNVALYGARLNQDMTRLNEELRLKVERVSEQRRQIAMLQAELTSTRVEPESQPVSEVREFRRGAMKGNSHPITEVLSMVQKVASSESSVFIRGESGTGKEVLAQVIHDNSPRRENELVCVHCAALSPNLLESELFGHVKGAFTGAHRDKIGRFEAANGGTLLLDEIGDISLETQVKLLRVIQERRFEPVGSNRSMSVDVRLITATHQNIEKLIAGQRFREDLYYRLNVISVELPPLRERVDDIIELAMHFLRRSSKRVGKRILHIDDEALSALEQHRWPGNIRELENVIERAVVLCESEHISIADLPSECGNVALPAKVGPVSRGRSPRADERTAADYEVASFSTSDQPATAALNNQTIPRSNKTLSENERDALYAALDECGGNKAKAARLLGIPRGTFYSKLRKYSIH